MSTNTQAAKEPPTVSGLQEYLKGVREELKKAIWPTRDELIKLTQVVVAIIAIVAVYCGAIDYVLALITDRIFGRIG